MPEWFASESPRNRPPQRRRLGIPVRWDVANRTSPVITRQFSLILALTLLAFTIEYVLRPVIPLIVVARGADAAMVGLIAAVHSLPSVIFRPLIGRVVDRGRHRRVLESGAVLAAISPLGLLVPGLAWLVPARFAQGSAWALNVVSTHTLMAKRAPPNRRGEAAGYYEAMPAVAALIGPTVGVTLYLGVGVIGPVVVATSLGLIAVVITTRVQIPFDSASAKAGAQAPPEYTSVRWRLLEPSALPATLMITTFMMAFSLFGVFPPVFAVAVNAPISTLVPYFLTYGTVSVLSQLLAGRVSDRLGRGLAIRIGCGIATVGLSMAAIGSTMLSFGLGGAAYAIGMAFVISATGAMTIDRAPAGRIGSAMATYSLGFQLATGVGSLLWGALIATAGFVPAFLVAIGFQAATFGASLRYATRP